MYSEMGKKSILDVHGTRGVTKKEGKQVKQEAESKIYGLLKTPTPFIPFINVGLRFPG